jgi:hypothetical protein
MRIRKGTHDSFNSLVKDLLTTELIKEGYEKELNGKE